MIRRCGIKGRDGCRGLEYNYSVVAARSRPTADLASSLGWPATSN